MNTDELAVFWRMLQTHPKRLSDCCTGSLVTNYVATEAGIADARAQLERCEAFQVRQAPIQYFTEGGQHWTFRIRWLGGEGCD